MPFSGPGDDSLPNHVKKLSEKKRREWVGVFNSSFETCRKRGQDDCEGVAFRNANSAVKEVMLEETNEKVLNHTCAKDSDKKCLACETGATSFEEIEGIQAAREKAEEMEGVTLLSEGLVRNILGRPEIEDKPKAIEKVMTGLLDRIKKLLGSTGKEEKQVTKTEDGVKFRASDYAVVPDKEKPSTWKLRLAEERSGNFTVKQVAQAITAMQPGGFRGQKVELEPGDKAQAVSRISAAINKLDAEDVQKDNLKARLNKIKENSFQVFKDKEGRWRWFALVSNNFRDKDNPPEILSAKAHEEFVDYLDKGGIMPELWLWHIPGTRCGKADWAAYDYGFLMVSGTMDEGMEDVAKALAQDEGLGVSHGFYTQLYDTKNQVIEKYRTFEVSPLPIECAANPWTSITVILKEVKAMDDKKRAFIVGKLGEERTNQLIEHPKELTQELLNLGVESKEVKELLKTEEKVEPQSTEELAKVMVKALGESEFFKGIQATLADVKANADQVPELIRRIGELEKTEDEKVADTLIKAAALAPKERATASEENIVKKGDEVETANPDTKWMAEALANFQGAVNQGG